MIDARIAALSARQRGLVHRRQLLDLGLGRGAIDHRIRVGRLFPVLPRVYAVGRPADDPWVPALAALLSLDRPAWLAGRTAARLWGILAAPVGERPRTEVLVIGSAPRPRAGAACATTARLHRQDVTRRRGLAVTGLARTIVDLAAVLDAATLERCLAEAVALHRLRPDAVRAAAARRSSTRGRATLRAVLDAAHGPRRSRSEAETAFLALVRRAGLPDPRTDVPLRGWTVDALWPAERVVVEVDGYAFHHGRRAFERDRRRDADLQAAGYVVLRLSWRQVVDEPEATAARLAALLARQAPQP
jgi:very-short-patch-repair endonuclease